MKGKTMRGLAAGLLIFGIVVVLCALLYWLSIWEAELERRETVFLHVAQENNIFMTMLVKSAYQEEDAFIMEVLRFAYDGEVADVSYHETDIVVKTVKGFVVTRRFPEIQFIHTRDGSIIKAIVWWYGGQYQWVEKWKKILKQKEKEMKEAKKKLEKERKK